MSSVVKVTAQLSGGVKREFVSPRKVRLILSWGFPYEAFGPSVAVKPWHIMNLVESGRAFSFHHLPNQENDPFLKIQDLYADYGLFQASTRLAIAKEMYDVSIPKTPLTLEKELVYVGKSSMNVRTDILLPSQALTLATCEVQSVLVDRKTRRPAPHPDWWREKFGEFSTQACQLKVNVENPPAKTGARTEPESYVDQSQDSAMTHFPLAMNQPASVPPTLQHSPDPQLVTESDQDLPIAHNVTSLNLTISSSDTDSYGHTNWTSFLKYCLDALLMGTSPEVSQQLQMQAMKSADVAFIREGSAGQRVIVKFWKDYRVPRAVHFNIVGSDSDQLITYAFLQFYSLQDVKLPVAKL